MTSLPSRRSYAAKLQSIMRNYANQSCVPCKTISDGSPMRSVVVSRVDLTVRTAQIPVYRPNNLVRVINFRGAGLNCKVPFVGLTSALPSLPFLNYHVLKPPVYMSGIRSDLRYSFKTNAREWMTATGCCRGTYNH